MQTSQRTPPIWKLRHITQAMSARSASSP
jgi:hypothetical protein